MAEETSPRGIMGYLKRFWDEAVLRSTVESLTQVASEQTKQGINKLKIKIFGWGDNDERISFEDQSALGQAAVQELNLWLKSLNDYWTYRFRIIISGIEDQPKRLSIYRMILNLPEADRRLQLEQICQNPEHIYKAGRWIWAKLKKAMDDRETQSLLRQIIHETAAEVHRTMPAVAAVASQEQIEAGLWARLDGTFEVWAVCLRAHNDQNQPQQAYRGFWRTTVRLLTGRG